MPLTAMRAIACGARAAETRGAPAETAAERARRVCVGYMYVARAGTFAAEATAMRPQGMFPFGICPYSGRACLGICPSVQDVRAQHAPVPWRARPGCARTRDARSRRFSRWRCRARRAPSAHASESARRPPRDERVSGCLRCKNARWRQALSFSLIGDRSLSDTIAIRCQNVSQSSPLATAAAAAGAARGTGTGFGLAAAAACAGFAGGAGLGAA